MKKTIEKLHTKSERYRKRLAFGTALSATLIIFLVWLSVAGVEFFEGGAVADQEPEEKTHVASPIASLRDDVKGVVTGIQELLKRLGESNDEALLEVVEEKEEYPGVYKNEVEHSFRNADF